MTKAMSESDHSVLSFLRQLADERYWGTVTVKYENGHIVHLRKEESLKPEQLLPKHRGYQNESICE
jgi:hypothetical protein